VIDAENLNRIRIRPLTLRRIVKLRSSRTRQAPTIDEFLWRQGLEQLQHVLLKRTGRLRARDILVHAPLCRIQQLGTSFGRKRLV